MGLSGKEREEIFEARSIDVAFGYLILRTARLVRLQFLNVLRKVGVDITPEQWLILNRLWENEGQSQVDLSDRIFKDRPNITRILDNMEKNGLIYRKEDKSDRRVNRVYLTPEGKGLEDKLWDITLNLRRFAYKGLTDQDLKEVRRILEQIEDNLRGPEFST